MLVRRRVRDGEMRGEGQRDEGRGGERCGEGGGGMRGEGKRDEGRGAGR